MVNLMNRLKKEEIKAVSVSVIAVVIFVATRLLHQPLSLFYNDDYYLLFHTLFELFSIFVSYSIFFHGWLTFPHTRSYQRLVLAMIFLSVGSIDMIHTLTYKGMPFFQSEHTLAIATWFWILARLTESIGLALILTRKRDKQLPIWGRRTSLIITLTYIGIVMTLVLTSAQQLPVLIIESTGVTPMKVGIEYFIGMIHLITLILVVQQYRRTSNVEWLRISVAIVFILIGELVFTLYENVYDLDNLLGHVYKAIGYYFLFRGIFFPQFQRVFVEKEQAEEKLKEQEQKMTSLILQAQEDERKRVSRDLHDGVGQALYSILVSLKMLRHSIRDSSLQEQMREVEHLTSEAMDEVKQIAFQLRPSVLDDLGFIPALRSQIEKYEHTFHVNISLDVKGTNQQRYTPEIETALYRIFQEALTNAVKYANTSEIEVQFTHEDDQIRLMIRDHGIGFDPDELSSSDRKGLGLFGIRERAALVGGEADIISKKGEGTVVRVRIPLITTKSL